MSNGVRLFLFFWTTVMLVIAVMIAAERRSRKKRPPECTNCRPRLHVDEFGNVFRNTRSVMFGGNCPKCGDRSLKFDGLKNVE